ncbi:ribbon-helix-helix domain-containing protein [Rhizobium halophilum]|uniref:ribbon-helix-helix domain-containing protein n=1 Tax=Rhizobium halophilum TaxID=2846852 RepID=UPI001EFDF9B7|nr:type II toxin-antitoxin system ParD family antitoxin [Rhizobium halophilum]MCF6367481.1 type II toxin-antitoxin system ParD family antitoxin [Rhizobium halophilum]
MSGRNFSITQHVSDFVDREVASGRHRSASEVVTEALRRYEDDINAEMSDLAVIAEAARNGEAAIDGGDFTLISGKDGSKELLERLNTNFARKQTLPGNG